MEITILRLVATTLIIAGLLAFTHSRVGSIKGTVTPAEGGVRAWAESVTDTIKAPIVNGTYEIPDVKPGAYKIIIEAKPPYRNIAKDGIMVNDGQTSDVGEIKLEK
ncbi:carboxypeptidase-like regulatory domain-containing protein [Puia dinghuensis]|uniref:Carboxypeptidase regulatory-like domain-containing protein n=1 Tax=Puia dinghuensis TaxID=1792502 RepID=A0A8J2U6R9_9BACT|nr:carboxypeptidase-like regulatory domain-containing protein [Puia dinghuensis]GGA82419.1 hypothetical protein GCM10011511_01730 [Puia dinghuensis]